MYFLGHRRVANFGLQGQKVSGKGRVLDDKFDLDMKALDQELQGL